MQELEERDIRGGFPKRVSTVQSMISRNLDWHENLVYKRKRQLHFSGLAWKARGTMPRESRRDNARAEWRPPLFPRNRMFCVLAGELQIYFEF